MIKLLISKLEKWSKSIIDLLTGHSIEIKWTRKANIESTKKVIISNSFIVFILSIVLFIIYLVKHFKL